MSIAIDLNINVPGAPEFHGEQYLACTVYLPDPDCLPDQPVVIFAVPGGGYSRAYYDMHFDGFSGYSEARFHTSRGMIFVSCDHLGVGESSQPDPFAISLDVLSESYAACVREVLKKLAAGEVDRSFPAVIDPVVVGIGQSFGGCVTIITQAQHQVFDGIGILGYSGIHTRIPQRTEAEQSRSTHTQKVDRDADLSTLQTVAESSSLVTDFTYAFHWEDEPPALVQADMGGGYPRQAGAVPPFGSLTLPPCAVQMVTPGIVATEAAAIDVPVLIAMGERDICDNPHQEPSAYCGSGDVQLAVIPGMAHMHNFANTRDHLWNRTSAWAARLLPVTR